MIKAHTSIGNVYNRLGRFEQALASYERVLELLESS